MTDLPYSEGSVFLVPLRSGGYARGVVARATDEGKVLFGYFFEPRLESTNSVPLNDLGPAGSILRVRFGDLGLVNGEWLVCGRVPNWDRTEWPMPEFVRCDPLSKKAWLVRYSDTNPNHIEEESPLDNASNLAPDSLAGYGAVEINLTQILS